MPYSWVAVAAGLWPVIWLRPAMVWPRLVGVGDGWATAGQGLPYGWSLAGYGRPRAGYGWPSAGFVLLTVFWTEIVCSRALLSSVAFLPSRLIVLSVVGCFGWLDRCASLAHEL